MSRDYARESDLQQVLQDLDALSISSKRAVFGDSMSQRPANSLTPSPSDDEEFSLCEMQQQCAALRQKMEELRLSLSLSLPHELRTPLNAILGFSSYLLSLEAARTEENTETAKIYAAIYTNACRLQHLIENYLIYARLQLIKENPEKLYSEMWQRNECFQPGAIVESIVEVHAGHAGREADIQLELDPGTLTFSKKSLQKMVEELLDNAIKFSKPGTPIRITSAFDEQSWRFYINDLGRGMSRKQIADIGAYVQFERNFYAQEGSGLGLAIVKLLTRIHGGSLSIDSMPNQGTTVTISLPQAQA